MHAERFEIPPATVAAIARTRARGGKVIAVGTTSLRALEAAAQGGELHAGAAETDIFITPGYVPRRRPADHQLSPAEIDAADAGLGVRRLDTIRGAYRSRDPPALPLLQLWRRDAADSALSRTPSPSVHSSLRHMLRDRSRHRRGRLTRQAGLTPDTHKVALACALLWTYRSPTEMHRLLGLCGLKTSAGKAFTVGDVKQAVQDLARRQLLLDDPRAPPLSSCPTRCARRSTGSCSKPAGDQLVQLICEPTILTRRDQGYYWGPRAAFRRPSPTCAPSSSGRAEPQSWRTSGTRSQSWTGTAFSSTASCSVSMARVSSASTPSALAACQPGHRQHLPALVAKHYLPVADWAFEQLAQRPAELSESLRMALADLAMQRADAACWKRRWPASTVAWPPACGPRCWSSTASGQPGRRLSKRRSSSARARSAAPSASCRQRRLVLSAVTARPGDARPPRAGAQVLRRRVRQREPDPYSGWGRWVHALDVRLGKAPLVRSAFRPSSDVRQRPDARLAVGDPARGLAG
jgi:hypothetical protein